MISLGGLLPRSKDYDVIVLGGGPAGATAGALLAGNGHRVLIVERDRFPRHHVGESLMPQTYWTFRRLGVLDRLRQSNYPPKESVQFVGPSGRDSEPYFFTDRDPGEWSTTWQVPRDCFDLMMLDNARAKGAEVCEGVGATEVIFDGDRAAGVKLVSGSRRADVAGRVIVDATGQTSLLSRQLKLTDRDPRLRNASIYGYFKGAYRDAGRNAGATIVIRTADRMGWFWFIPLPDDLTSVGIVAPPERLFSDKREPLKVFLDEIETCPGILKRLENAERVDEVRVLKDYTYTSDRAAGNGWVLVGDAFGFLDPVYSSGVFLALKSGEMAADAVHDALQAGDTSAARLGAFERELKKGMYLLRQLVYSFYDTSFSVGKFLAEHPEYEDHLVRLLIGDVFNDEVPRIFEKMKDWTDVMPWGDDPSKRSTACEH